MNVSNERQQHAEIFHRHIMQLFKESNMGKDAFARETGVNPATLVNILQGPTLPSSYTVIKICKTLNVESDWLLGLMDV